jgi:hypothetical protein
VSVVVHWWEASPHGPSLEFLCQVADMGVARALATQAETMNDPTKEHRLNSRHPLVTVASRHPGELLWRPLPPEDINPYGDPAHPEWEIGARSAQAFRAADVLRYRTTYEAAQERRRERRRHGR